MDHTALMITIIASNLVLMITAIGVTVTFFLKSESRIDAIQEEMKDFHTRLAIQDFEFKASMKNIEEKRNRILMGVEK